MQFNNNFINLILNYVNHLQCLSKAEDITFINACASDFVEIYVGSGPKKVRDIFDSARRFQPAILFIDELEAIGVQRSNNIHQYTNNVERYSTLNQVINYIIISNLYIHI